MSRGGQMMLPGEEDPGNIGKRAYREVMRLYNEELQENPHKQFGIFIRSIGITHNCIVVWRRGQCPPSAVSLQRLYNAGADIVYIVADDS